MKTKTLMFGICVMLLAAVIGYSTTQKHRWAVHDKNRPQPRVIVPGNSPANRRQMQSFSSTVVTFRSGSRPKITARPCGR